MLSNFLFSGFLVPKVFVVVFVFGFHGFIQHQALHAVATPAPPPQIFTPLLAPGLDFLGETPGEGDFCVLVIATGRNVGSLRRTLQCGFPVLDSWVLIAGIQVFEVH